MSSRLLRGAVTVGAAAVLMTAPLLAQEGHRTMAQSPSIVVNGSAEVEMTPDRASLGVAVETRARTAAAAASENARVQTQVLRAIRAAGIPERQIRTQTIRVTPEYEYPREGGRPTVTGYVAQNGVDVEIRDLTRVGVVVDAALSQGATNVSGPRFFLANADSARRVALDAAVRTALADAEVMARAAGLQLGQIIEMALEGGAIAPMGDGVVMMARAQEAAPTPVMSGTITVSASVRLRVGVRR